ncbi:MAG: hypothetical protein MJZ20_07975 [Bacteroidaceae bacterium]|nr:hypothetical protein [Bacteroidaceae bacterium]
MAKNHELKNTKYNFEVRGIVAGVKRDKFYASGIGKNGSAWNRIRFSLQVAPKEYVTVTLMGNVRDKVYVYNKKTKSTNSVKWDDRYREHDGRLIGIGVGLSKDESGKNENVVLTEYDAVEYMHKNLEDGMSVYVRGTLSPHTFERDGNTRHSVDMIINSIYLCKDNIDFDSEDFERKASFDSKAMLFHSIDKETDADDKATGRFVVSAYNVEYAAIEPISFIVDEAHAKSLANPMKKAMKPCQAIEIDGTIVVNNFIEEVEDDDDLGCWGDADTVPQKRQKSHSIVEFRIDHAYPGTIDKETYSERELSAAIVAIAEAKNVSKQFGDNTKKAIDIEPDDDEADAMWGDDDSSEYLPWD